MAHVQLAGVLRHLRRLIAPQDAGAQTDGQLLQRFVADRDDVAFTELVRRHGPMVLGVCRRLLGDPHDADDAFQATFLVLTRKARALNQWGSLGNWLYTVAYRLALWARATTAKRRAQERQVEDMPQPPASNEAWRELHPLLDGEVNRLPAKYRAPVVLCYLEGKTNEEAAQELGWPAGTVKCRLARARERLRRRLAGRGAMLGNGLLAPALTEQASAAVSDQLLESTLRTASLFAAGESAAAGTLSVRAVFLAEGALQTMFVHKLKAMAAVLLVLGLVGTGAGFWLQSAPAGPPVEDQPPVRVAVAEEAAAPDAAADPQLPKDKEKPRPGERARQIRRALSQYVTMDAIPPNTTLGEAIKKISEQFKVAIELNESAFTAIGVQNVEEQPVALPKMTNVRLSMVLKKLVGQIKGDQYVGSFLIRPDRIELTTTYHEIIEGGADPFPPVGIKAPEGVDDNPIVPVKMGYFGTLRRMTPLVLVDCERQSLVEVLRELSEDSGHDIVIDPRVAEKARAAVTLTVNNVFLDNAVNLLTELAELDWYWMDRVVYVTSKEKANAHREKLKARATTVLAPAKEQGGSRTVSVNCDQKPLGEVLGGLPGVQVVYDQRISKTAPMWEPVTAKLKDVPPETAIRILTDMVGLGVVPMDGAFYVTSKENARAMRGQNKP